MSLSKVNLLLSACCVATSLNNAFDMAGCSAVTLRWFLLSNTSDKVSRVCVSRCLLCNWSRNTALLGLGLVNVAFSCITNSLFCASYLSALALTVDRFLAIHFNLRYQQVVTCKRSFAAVISLFMISASLSCVGFWVTHAFTNSFRNSLPYDKLITLLPHLFSSSTPKKSNACTASSVDKKLQRMMERKTWMQRGASN